MLNNILNLEGVTVLENKQQKKVNGGNLMYEGQECTFTYVDAWTGESQTVTSGGYPPGQAGSTQANSDCVDMIVSGGATSCSYNCSWDD